MYRLCTLISRDIILLHRLCRLAGLAASVEAATIITVTTTVVITVIMDSLEVSIMIFSTVCVEKRLMESVL